MILRTIISILSEFDLSTVFFLAIIAGVRSAREAGRIYYNDSSGRQGDVYTGEFWGFSARRFHVTLYPRNTLRLGTADERSPCLIVKLSTSLKLAASFLIALVTVGPVLLAGCASVPGSSTPIIVKRSQMHMGTLVTITAVAPTEQAAQSAVSTGFQEIHRLEGLLSTWIQTSELSRVNAAAGREPVKVSPETFTILKRSLDMARLTDGGFNIVIGPAVEAWSVTEREHIPNDKELDAIRPLVDLSHIQLNEAERTVFLTRSGMRVDVGGIGKGFTADLAARVMQEAGALAGVVALSGDIKTFGRLPDGAKFPFGIRHPREEGVLLAIIELQDEAISTAGDYERFFEREGVRYHHILDPRTLHPARGCQSVTVIAQEGTVADGLDTGMFVMGPERGMELVERLPGVEALIIDAKGQIHVSSGLRARIRLLTDSTESGR